MKVKVSTYGGVLGWLLRKYFSSLTSYIWLKTQFILRKGSTLNFINNFSENDNPLIVSVETINRCNSKCSFCHASVQNETRPLAFMDERLFKKIISDLKDINYDGTLILTVNNEPFMDKRIIDFHRHARTELPNSHILLFTNGILLTLEKFLELAPFVDELIINNYSSTLVLHDNLKQILEYAKRNKDTLPHLKVKIQKRLMNEKLSNRANSAPNKKGSKKINQPCLFPFVDFVVFPNGTAGICTCDALEKSNMGNCTDQSVQEIWRSEKYRQARKAMRETRVNNDMCTTCDFLDTDIRLKTIRNKGK